MIHQESSSSIPDKKNENMILLISERILIDENRMKNAEGKKREGGLTIKQSFLI
jgi:hypothetical protein